MNLNVCIGIIPSALHTSGTFLLDGSVIDGLEFSVVTITILSGSAKAYEIKNGSRPIFSI